MTSDFIVLTVGAFYLVSWAVGFYRAIAVPRRQEAIVWDWARQNGYAILSIKYKGCIFDYVLLFFLGWIGLAFRFGPHEFRLLIQDDQGGQTSVTVYVSKAGKPLDVRWG